MSNVISFTHVSKTYDNGRAAALTGISFNVESGSFVCIVGPSGCGKSTILKIISGLDIQTAGQVQKPQHTAMVFQSGALLPWLNVYDNIAFGLKSQHLPERHIHLQTEKYMDMMGLSGFADKFPRELSGGQRQRVGIARALAVEPETLLLDEPFSALDTATTEELHKDLLKIWKQTEKTIVMVSHSIEEAVTLADNIIVMGAGKIISEVQIPLPRPRREQEAQFMHDVQNIRKMFF
jgi:NitT/TauT family transport system ATP-binding protein